MLFVGGEAFLVKILFLTCAQKSKVTARSKLYDTRGQGHWLSESYLIEIRQSLPELDPVK